MYVPSTGRFLTRDPLPQNGIDVLYGPRYMARRLRSAPEHPYAYAINNPTNYTDPSGLHVEKDKIIDMIQLNKMILAIEQANPKDSCIGMLCRLAEFFDPRKPCTNRFVWLAGEKHYLDVGHFFAGACLNAGGSPGWWSVGLASLFGWGFEVWQWITLHESAQPLGGGDGEDLPSNWKGYWFGTLFTVRDMCKPCRKHGISIELVKKLLEWNPPKEGKPDLGPLYEPPMEPEMPTK